MNLEIYSTSLCFGYSGGILDQPVTTMKMIQDSHGLQGHPACFSCYCHYQYSGCVSQRATLAFFQSKFSLNPWPTDIAIATTAR